MQFIVKKMSDKIIPFISVVLFLIAIYGFLSKRSLFKYVICTIIISFSPILNFSYFSRYYGAEGIVFSYIALAVESCLLAVQLAILYIVHQRYKDLTTEKLRELKW